MEPEMTVSESVAPSKGLYLQSVMILDCSRVDCIIGRLHSPCYWPSDIFVLYGLSETWPLIVTIGWRRDAGMTIRVSCPINWIALTGRCTRHDIDDCSSQLYRQKDCIYRSSINRAAMLTPRYVPAVQLVLDQWFPCQCRCLISWYVGLAEF